MNITNAWPSPRRGVTAISFRPLPTTGEGRRPWPQRKGRPVGGPDALAHVRLRQEGKPGAVPMALMRARGSTIRQGTVYRQSPSTCGAKSPQFGKGTPSLASIRAAGAGKAPEGQGHAAPRHCEAAHHGLACPALGMRRVHCSRSCNLDVGLHIAGIFELERDRKCVEFVEGFLESNQHQMNSHRLQLDLTFGRNFNAIPFLHFHHAPDIL